MKQPVPRLHLIGPLEIPTGAYVGIATAAARGGCGGIHVRMPGLPTDETLALARTLRGLIRNTALIVNDRIDIALLAHANGVQLGEHSFSVADAHTLLGQQVLIGRSVHDQRGAQEAEADGADFLLAGHVFDTPSKLGVAGRGLDWLERICSTTTIPVIALGGISVDRISAVMDTGAHGVAMGRELLGTDDPEATARKAMTIVDTTVR